MKDYFDRLFPLNRSLTGKGVEETLNILKEITDFNIIKVPSGTKVFDWVVPKEWEVKDAYIEFKGHRIVDFKKNNLHLVGYSTPVDAVLTLEELQEHLYSLPDQQNAIPYRTSYYKKNWGFCITENQRKRLKKGKYHVVIDSKFKKGNVLIGEYVVKGLYSKEYWITTYSCHPSMANDNISGMLTWIYLLKWMKEFEPYYTYRFLISPETIGALINLNRCQPKDVLGALVLTHTGGTGKWGYKKTFKGTDRIDKAMSMALKNVNHTISPFHIRGSDERQYSSPAFRIPTGIIYKTKFFDSPEYHTSLDNKIDFKAVWQSVNYYMDVISMLDTACKIRSFKKGEPMMSKRNMYVALGGQKPHFGGYDEALMWVLFYGDGEHDLIDICSETGLDYDLVLKAIDDLFEEGLICKRYT